MALLVGRVKVIMEKLLDIADGTAGIALPGTDAHAQRNEQTKRLRECYLEEYVKFSADVNWAALALELQAQKGLGPSDVGSKKAAEWDLERYMEAAFGACRITLDSVAWQLLEPAADASDAGRRRTLSKFFGRLGVQMMEKLETAGAVPALGAFERTLFDMMRECSLEELGMVVTDSEFGNRADKKYERPMHKFLREQAGTAMEKEQAGTATKPAPRPYETSVLVLSAKGGADTEPAHASVKVMPGCGAEWVLAEEQRMARELRQMTTGCKVLCLTVYHSSGWKPAGAGHK